MITWLFVVLGIIGLGVALYLFDTVGVYQLSQKAQIDWVRGVVDQSPAERPHTYHYFSFQLEGGEYRRNASCQAENDYKKGDWIDVTYIRGRITGRIYTRSTKPAE